jgi:nucleoside-diphosphate-sugar epimerase
MVSIKNDHIKRVIQSIGQCHFMQQLKFSNELMADSYSRLYNIKMIGLRLFTVYGPFGRPDMAIFNLTNDIIEKKNYFS